MPNHSKLNALANEAGLPPVEVILNALNRTKSYERAAVELGVTTQTMFTWRDLFNIRKRPAEYYTDREPEHA